MLSSHFPDRSAGARLWAAVLVAMAAMSLAAACGATAEPTSTPTPTTEPAMQRGEIRAEPTSTPTPPTEPVVQRGEIRVEPTSMPTQSSEPTVQPGEFQVVFSPKQRVAGIDAPGPDLEALVGGNTEFALDLYQVLRRESSTRSASRRTECRLQACRDTHL